MKTAGLAQNLHDLQNDASHFAVEALSAELPPQVIQEVLQETGAGSKRVRKIPADLTVWMVILMGLLRTLSIPRVYRRLREGFQGRLSERSVMPPTSRAFTKARDRLGIGPLQRLFERFCAGLGGRFDDQHRWNGLTLLAVDGTTAKVPDSKINRREFGAPGSHRGRSGYPFVRIVTLMAASTHLILAAAIGGWNTGEIPLALTLIPQIPAGALLLLDRGYIACWFLWQVLQHQSHFVVRARKRMRIRKRRKLGPGDWLAQAFMPVYLRRRNPELPESLTVRVVHYRRPGFRSRTLMTSLLDPDRFPAVEIAAVYHQRWEQELGYDELKTHMAATAVTFRSQTPTRIRQEVYGLLLAYTLVRSLMAQAASRAALSPQRLSFADALESVQRHCLLMAVAPTWRLFELYESMLREIGSSVLPVRRQRRCPRAVKVKMSSWPLKRSRRA